MKAIKSARFRRLFKESLWIVLGQVMVILGSLIGVRLLTELLSPVAYGELTLGMTVAILVAQTIMGPLSGGVMRFYALAIEKKDFNSYLSAVRQLVVQATTAIIVFMLLSVIVLLIIGQTNWIPITAFAFIFAIFSGYDSILNGMQNAARQRIIVALHNGIKAWGRYLIAAGFVLWLGASSSVVMLGYTFALIAVLISQFMFFRRTLHKKGYGKNQRNWHEQIWKYSWPFSTWGIFYWLQVSSDRWALELFATTRDVGLYAVLFQLGYYPMSMLTGMAIQFLAPIFYQRAGDASDSGRNANVNNLSWRLISLFIGLASVIFLVVLLLHKQIFKTFVAADYASVSYLLPWLFLASGLFAAGQTIALNLQSQMKTNIMIRAKIITALIGITLNFVGAFYYGIVGIVIANFLSSTSYFLWMSILSSKTISN